MASLRELSKVQLVHSMSILKMVHLLPSWYMSMTMYHVISFSYPQKVITEAAKKLVDFINHGPFHGKYRGLNELCTYT